METANRLDHLQMTLIRRFVAAAPDGALNLGLGQTNEPVPDAVLDRVATAARSGGAPYGPNAGLPALRERIAGRYGVGADRVIVTAGVQEATFLTLMAMLNPGDTIVVPDPGFPVYGTIARMFGANVVPWKLRAEDGFKPTAAGLQEILDREPVDMVVVCSPGNPTGAVADPEELAAIGKLCVERSVHALSDEIYLPFQQRASAPHGTMLEHLPEAFVTSGLSKSHGMAGWRLGWLIVPSAVVAKVVALHQHIMTSASTLVQDAALAAFCAESDVEVARLAESLGTRCDLAAQALRDAGWVVGASGGAFYLWFRHPEQDDGTAVATRLRDEFGVIVLPGAAFGPAGASWLRLSYSISEELLTEALNRIARAI